MEADPQVFDLYWERLVHSEDFMDPTATYDFYELRNIRSAHSVVNCIMESGNETFHVPNEAEQRHVEHVVIERLHEILNRPEAPKKPLTVKLYQNFSPCNWQEWHYFAGDIQSLCCNALVDFKRNYPQVELEIIFAGLYNINRPSCVNNPRCRRHNPVPNAVSNANILGLQNLRANGIAIRTFAVEDWQFLHGYFGRQGDPPAAARPEDARMAQDLADVLAMEVPQ